MKISIMSKREREMKPQLTFAAALTITTLGLLIGEAFVILVLRLLVFHFLLNLTVASHSTRCVVAMDFSMSHFLVVIVVIVGLLIALQFHAMFGRNTEFVCPPLHGLLVAVVIWFQCQANHMGDLLAERVFFFF